MRGCDNGYSARLNAADPIPAAIPSASMTQVDMNDRRRTIASVRQERVASLHSYNIGSQSGEEREILTKNYVKLPT